MLSYGAELGRTGAGAGSAWFGFRLRRCFNICLKGQTRFYRRHKKRGMNKIDLIRSQIHT